MPRILTDQPNKVTFLDNIGGGKLTLLYRMPSTDERIEYTNAQVSRKGRKIESITGTTRQKYGAKILVGITDGEWQKADKTPLSSDEKSPYFDAKWKDIIKDLASDVIAMLAIHVFENALSIDTSEEDEAGEGEDPT